MKNKCALFVTLLVLVALSVSGCNTIHGAGQDIQAGGHAIAKAAE